ncbi:hypothetical protein Ga0061063_1688 [Gulbenkiania indica]|uniref:Uncharacterized protein n=1 Tax=Gulbenkiania indica TaxID=375574 RepID=A0A0K6GXU6_9NEIS|nr:hypothetical protein Ga0061063_1688 [Gulbenkiania indica]
MPSPHVQNAVENTLLSVATAESETPPAVDLGVEWIVLVGGVAPGNEASLLLTADNPWCVV